jgi:Bacterial Ig-like domain (group 2)
MCRRLVLALLTLCVAGCGGGGGSSSSSSSPSSPTTTAPTTVSVAISPSTDMLKIRGTETFTVTATMSDGTSRAVAGTWTSGAAPVATVDSSGKVTAVASGQATITVTYSGASATRTIRVVPDYQGSWTGDYTVLSCQDSGGFHQEDWCKAAMADPVVRVTMTLTQTRDTVDGTWTHKLMAGAVQGTIEADGTLALTGNGSTEGTPITIAGWRTLSTDNRTQTGRYTLTFTSSVWSGSSQAGVEIRTCSKGS